MIGEETAESIEEEITRSQRSAETQAEIRGRDLVSGLPRRVVLTRAEVSLVLDGTDRT